MKKLMTSFALVTMTVSFVAAQQLPQFSEYMLNEYVLNPGVTGVKNYFEVKANYRQNWAGFEGAPVTQTLSVNGPISNGEMGVGGFVFHDKTGPVQRIGVEGSYAYNISVRQTSKLSVGIAAGAFNYRIAREELKLETQVDQVIQDNNLSLIVPDVRFGVYLHNPKYWAGISAPQLVPAKLDFTGVDRVEVSQLARHYYLMGGYNFTINDQFSVEPSLYIKAVQGAPIQVDINSRFFYQEKYWIGFSYRTQDAAVGLLGLTIKNNLHLAYAYDYTLSGLKDYSNGSHEIMLGYDFGKEAKGGAAPRY